VITPCAGNPCQELINKLNGIVAYYNQIKQALERLKEIKKERSEILKKLVYSRKKIDKCSEITEIAETAKKEIKILGCERVLDEIIPPIATKFPTGCYGGRFKNLTERADNWFCCEKIKEE
jgi:hypothetical protein